MIRYFVLSIPVIFWMIYMIKNIIVEYKIYGHENSIIFYFVFDMLSILIYFWGTITSRSKIIVLGIGIIIMTYEIIKYYTWFKLNIAAFTFYPLYLFLEIPGVIVLLLFSLFIEYLRKKYFSENAI
ncbi:MAG: hypothetical protein A2297_07300 [Elusimicrobia bacterium RIFOXYB2_FULL_48_7]|nr:MAG: hypothetical protein A2297_07300 [Elusimicrobia bacterium RIFOXYB2_FULL_48_7]